MCVCVCVCVCMSAYAYVRACVSGGVIEGKQEF